MRHHASSTRVSTTGGGGVSRGTGTAAPAGGILEPVPPWPSGSGRRRRRVRLRGGPAQALRGPAVARRRPPSGRMSILRLMSVPRTRQHGPTTTEKYATNPPLRGAGRFRQRVNSGWARPTAGPPRRDTQDDSGGRRLPGPVPPLTSPPATAPPRMSGGPSRIRHLASPGRHGGGRRTRNAIHRFQSPATTRSRLRVTREPRNRAEWFDGRPVRPSDTDGPEPNTRHDRSAAWERGSGWPAAPVLGCTQVPTDRRLRRDGGGDFRRQRVRVGGGRRRRRRRPSVGEGSGTERLHPPRDPPERAAGVGGPRPVRST